MASLGASLFLQVLRRTKPFLRVFIIYQNIFEMLLRIDPHIFVDSFMKALIPSRAFSVVVLVFSCGFGSVVGFGFHVGFACFLGALCASAQHIVSVIHCTSLACLASFSPLSLSLSLFCGHRETTLVL